MKSFTIVDIWHKANGIMVILCFLNTCHGFIYPNQSEIVKIPTMGSFINSSLARFNCPHLMTGLISFGNLFLNGLISKSNTTIPSGSSVLIKASDIAALSSTGYLNRITIQSSASLTFDDSDITLRVREIVIETGGSLFMGSESCRLNAKIQIIFLGSKLDSSLIDSTTDRTSKGLISSGLLSLHGKIFHPTWTRLAATANKSSNIIYLQDKVNWEVGQSILLTTTVYLDCPLVYQLAYCSNKAHQNEVRIIASVSMNDITREYKITVATILSYAHFADISYQGEVALLSRNIIFQGSESNDNFGGHIKVKSSVAVAKLSGIQAENMGQLNVLGRYPFHLHMLGNSTTSFFQDCSVTNSKFRSFVVHGSNNVRVSRNVAYNVMGMSFYLEDGVEENNLFEFNLAAHTHPIFRPADGDWGQQGETFTASLDLIIPADTSASGFYISNSMNTFIGNAVSGGWSGYAFPNIPSPLGVFQGSLPIASNLNPMKRPLKKFYGNTAHSTGFYWRAHGSAVYVGAWLAYDAVTGLLTYNSGRNSRTTTALDGSKPFMVFEHTKVFLCNTGIAHWGDAVKIIYAEIHDARLASFMFGEGLMAHALINAQSRNPVAAAMTYQVGFQFYDTWVLIMLYDVEFRHFSSARSECAIRYTDHSDHYLPQGINAVKGLKWMDVDNAATLCLQNCGADCATSRASMSSKIQSVWDYDGSLSQTGIPTIIGTNSDWWNVDSSCSKNVNTKLWSCPWPQTTDSNRTIGFISPMVPGLYQGCDSVKFSTCTDQYAPNLVGRMNYWGKAIDSGALAMGPWPGVSGMTNMGWYWRVVATDYGIDGAPSYFEVGNYIQLPKNKFIILAIAYPAATIFDVSIALWGNALPSVPMSSSLSSVLSLSEEPIPPQLMTCTGAWYTNCQYTGLNTGFSWYFDGSYLYLRIVNFPVYSKNYRYNSPPGAGYFSGYGMSMNRQWGGHVVKVSASCGSCAIQSTLGTINFYSVGDVVPPKPLSSSPTFAPYTSASAPTAGPSLSPSNVSTRCPSEFPSAQSTKVPSRSPSNVPTKWPSIPPSRFPSRQPTLTPSRAPSKSPITAPTKSPSSVPTRTPSRLPSILPSRTPSRQPSLAPSRAPSNKPSVSPTKWPSNTPTRVPTKGPSVAPTRVPSVTPTLTTKSPSCYPNVSRQPSRIPT